MVYRNARCACKACRADVFQALCSAVLRCALFIGPKRDWLHSEQIGCVQSVRRTTRRAAAGCSVSTACLSGPYSASSCTVRRESRMPFVLVPWRAVARCADGKVDTAAAGLAAPHGCAAAVGSSGWRRGLNGCAGQGLAGRGDARGPRYTWVIGPGSDNAFESPAALPGARSRADGRPAGRRTGSDRGRSAIRKEWVAKWRGAARARSLSRPAFARDVHVVVRQLAAAFGSRALGFRL